MHIRKYIWMNRELLFLNIHNMVGTRQLYLFRTNTMTLKTKKEYWDLSSIHMGLEFT